MGTLRIAAVLLVAATLAAGAAARPAQREPLPAPVDVELEKFSDHNLDVGKHYFKRKAYAAVKDRLLEIVEVYPEYTKIDEVYLLLGQSFERTKQPDRAREFLERLLAERPESPLAKKAREELDRLPKGS